MEIVTICDPSDHGDAKGLVKQAYADILAKVFPERELDSCKRVFDSVRGKCVNERAAVIIAGEDLDDPARRVLHGAAIAYFFIKQSIGFLAYNAKRPGSAASGLGDRMVAARTQALKDLAASYGNKLEAIILDVHNPDKMTAEERENDAMPPEKRIALFKKFGAHDFPFEFDYVQPPAGKKSPHCFNLKLMYYPVDGRHPGPEQVKGFLTAVYEVASNGKTVTDQHYLHSIQMIDEWQARQGRNGPAANDAGVASAPPVRTRALAI